MKNREYWEKRFTILQAQQLNRGIEYYHNLAQQYEKAVSNVQKEIEIFYRRFAENNEIDLIETKKLLNTRQLKEFKWDVEEYIEKGKTLNYSDRWAKELENASIRYRVTRLEALKLQMQQQVESLIGYEVDGLDNLIRQIYEDNYYKTIFELQKGIGVASSFAILDTDKINKVISKPWSVDGTNFSKRVWGQHRPELIQKLNTDFVQSIIRGEAPQKLIKKIADDFNVTKYKAQRLILTESSFFASESKKDAFKELEVKYFSICATLDTKTCTDCAWREGEKIPMSLFEVGVTAPPFHPNCRCCILPENEDDDDISSYRAARDKDDNYIEVPGNMTYQQWKGKFVDDKKNILKTNNESAKINPMYNKNKADYELLGSINTKLLEKEFSNIKTAETVVTAERLNHIKLRHPQDYDFFIKYGKLNIEKPDLIIKDGKNNNTVFMIKKIDDTNLNVIIKLSLVEDIAHPKNSVMTFYRIRDKNLNKLISKNKLLYNKE